MTEIKFYHNAPDRLRAACAITAKAVRQGRRIWVYAPEESIARRYNHMLWSYQPLSFVPHVMHASPLAARTPVVIASSLSGALHQDVVINLGADHLTDFEAFSLLVEIVSQEPSDRQVARQRWAHYKERGYSIEAYDLAKLTGT